MRSYFLIAGRQQYQCPYIVFSTIVRLLLLLMLPFALPAQTLNYTQYTTRDGLAGEVVHAMAQDKDGFIWFATETGLSRFDGTRFRNFTTADGLPSNEILGLYIDVYNRLWIHTFKNAACYYKNGRIYNRNNSRTLRALRTEKVIMGTGAAADSTQILWYGGAWVSCLKGDSVFLWPKDKYFPGLTYFSGDIPPGFVMSPENWSRLNTDATECCYSLSGASGIIQQKSISRVYILQGSTLISNIKVRDAQFVMNESDSTIWHAGNEGGVRIFDFRHSKTLATYFRGYTIYFVFRDREGNTWFGTDGDGVFKTCAQPVAYYTLNRNRTSSPVQWIQRKGPHLYASDARGNLYRVSSKHPSPGKPRLPELTVTPEKATIDWLKGTMEEKLVFYANSDFLDLVPGHAIAGIKTLFAFHDTLLLAASREAELRDLRSGKSIRFQQGRTTCAIRYQGKYFIGTLKGLDIYTSALSHIAHFLEERISYFAWNDKELWLSTYDNGLYRYRNGVIEKAVSKDNGLSSNLCRCIFLDGKYLWAGTDKGINKIDISVNPLKVVRQYTAADGLSSDIINTIYVENSVVYVGTQKGLNCLIDTPPPESICNLKLTDIYISGNPVPTDSVLQLRHKDNNISFLISGISFLSGGDIRYEYRLLGLDPNWQSTQEQTLSFLSLPSGAYTLQVRARNRFGKPSPLLEKNFEIRKTVVEQWWFGIAVLLLSSALILLLVHFRIKRVKHRETEKQEMNRKILDLEQMALRAQMNPHFIFNCLNSIQNYIIRRDADSANFYLSQFAQLVRQTLDNATRVYISLREEIGYISSYLDLEQVQLGAAFRYTITVDPRLDQAAARIPNMVTQPFIENAIKHGLSRQKTGGLLEIRYDWLPDSNMLECSIRDNGPGIEAERARTAHRTHKPKGISITRQRIEMLNKMQGKGKSIAVKVEDTGTTSGESGTLVRIHIPISTK